MGDLESQTSVAQPKDVRQEELWQQQTKSPDPGGGARTHSYGEMVAGHSMEKSLTVITLIWLAVSGRKGQASLFFQHKALELCFCLLIASRGQNVSPGSFLHSVVKG